MSLPDVVDGARSQQRIASKVIVAIESHEGAVQMQITTIGLDIAKNVFQVHAIDGDETVVARKQLRRGQVVGFFRTCRRASSAWRPVPRHTIGRVSSPSWAMRCG